MVTLLIVVVAGGRGGLIKTRLAIRESQDGGTSGLNTFESGPTGPESPVGEGGKVRLLHPQPCVIAVGEVSQYVVAAHPCCHTAVCCSIGRAAKEEAVCRCAVRPTLWCLRPRNKTSLKNHERGRAFHLPSSLQGGSLLPSANPVTYTE